MFDQTRVEQPAHEGESERQEIQKEQELTPAERETLYTARIRAQMILIAWYVNAELRKQHVQDVATARERLSASWMTTEAGQDRFSQIIGRLTDLALSTTAKTALEGKRSYALWFNRGLLALGKAALPKEGAMGYDLDLTPSQAALAEKLQAELCRLEGEGAGAL